MATTMNSLHEQNLYLAGNDDIMEAQTKKMEQLYDYNMSRPSEFEKRTQMLKEMFAEIGEGCYIEPPLHSNWGGGHLHFGKGVYANFGLTCVDDTHIYVGDYTMFGPNCVLATAGHPLIPELRPSGYQYNIPIHIGKNCWFGAGVIVMPGITIGDNVVLGAGSVVTKDIPSNTIAVGNPCKVLRKIGKKDLECYFKDRPIDWATVEDEIGIKKSDLEMKYLD